VLALALGFEGTARKNQEARLLLIREVELELRGLDVLIGANASGKSNVLDALAFLAQGVSQKDFGQAVGQRGGMFHLAWKGDVAHQISLETQYQRDEDTRFTWSVRLRRVQLAVIVIERVDQIDKNARVTPILEAYRARSRQTRSRLAR
jgi:predicted ATPase